MSAIKLSTPSSGSISLTPADTASNLTITVPAATGEVMVSGNMPAFSAYSNSTQTISTNTWTKVTLNTENFDTNSNFDSTTNYRFTPTVAGYYQISWAVFNGLSSTNAYSQLYKNAVGIAYGGTSQPGSGLGSQISTGAFLVQMNGSTDYLELYSYSGSTSVIGGSTVTYMTGVLVRAE
jgi:hypothetical protein